MDKTRIDPHSPFTEQRLYENPPAAIVRGEVVRVAALGNVEGASPAYLCWHGDGHSSIEPIDQVTMIDFNTFPPSAEQVRDVLSKLQKPLVGSNR